jgi:uncharacterized protein YecE (DUF72 family)
VSDPPIHLGTSSFTAAGWDGTFYPARLKSADRLSYYAEHFDTVEIDSTFYGCPSAKTVENWARKTPAGFIFSVKVPQTITHDKMLVDCDAELKEFLDTMGILGEKLGPMVFQFPLFDKWKVKDQAAFLPALVPFLKKLPAEQKFAVEIRNKTWLDAHFADLLREHQVALVLQDLSSMPGPADLSKKFDPITAAWTYIRWLGDRKGIETITQTWNKTVVDRIPQLSSWIDFCHQIRKRGVIIYAYANNHYAGHAPATIEQFRNLWRSKGHPELPQSELPKRKGMPTELPLFDEPSSL